MIIGLDSFFSKSFSSVRISVSPAALALLATFSGGLPVLAHEIGEAACNADADGIITQADASNAVILAADIAGRKHLEPQVLRAITSPRYRSILAKLAQQPFEFEFQRQEAMQRLSSDEARVFDNFLRRMRTLGVITALSERGTYRFVSNLHYLYFCMMAMRARQEGGG